MEMTTPANLKFIKKKLTVPQIVQQVALQIISMVYSLEYASMVGPSLIR